MHHEDLPQEAALAAVLQEATLAVVPQEAALVVWVAAERSPPVALPTPAESLALRLCRTRPPLQPGAAASHPADPAPARKAARLALQEVAPVTAQPWEEVREAVPVTVPLVIGRHPAHSADRVGLRFQAGSR